MIRVGTLVRLKHNRKAGTAKVSAIFRGDELPNGVRLRKHLNGYLMYSSDDLERVPQKGMKRSSVKG